MLSTVCASYRPEGKPPVLPLLTPESPPEDFIRYAVLRNTKVEERFHLWASAVHQITVARSLPDPQLHFEADVGKTLDQLFLGYLGTYPGAGKLKLAGEAQSHAAVALRHEFQQEVADVATEAHATYFEAALLEETIELDRAVVGIVKEFEDLATARFRVNKVTEQDVLRAQIEKDQVENELVSMENNRSVLQAKLRRILGIPIGEPDPPIPKRLPETGRALPEGDLVEQVLANHRGIHMRAEELREAEVLVALARKTGSPDLMVEPDIQLVSPIFVAPEAWVSLPIYLDKIGAAIEKAIAMRRAAGSNLESERLTAVQHLAEWLYAYQDAGRRVALLRDRLLPKATAALEIARRNYPTDKADLTSLLDAERSLFSFRRMELRAKTEREIAWCQIVYHLIGRRPNDMLFQGAQESRP